MFSRQYTNYFQNIYDHIIVNIEATIYEETDYSNDIIGTIKNLIDKYNIKSIEKIIPKYVNSITREEIIELIFYIENKNKILENNIKSNTYFLKFIFFNILNFLSILFQIILIFIII